MNTPAQPQYWNGVSAFTPGQTPFGFYDTDPDFVKDADRFINYAARKMGWPQFTVELVSGSYYAALEEAVMVYSNEIQNAKIRDNYLSMEGQPTASVNPNAPMVPTLANVIRLAEQYGSEAGAGGTVTYYTGSIDLRVGVQNYDLNAWASSSGIVGAGDRIEIKRIFHNRVPAQMRYFDPTTFNGVSMPGAINNVWGLGGFSPAVNYTLVPFSLDALRVQAIEFNDLMRRSDYTFDLINNQLRIFPIPEEDHKLFFHYIKQSERGNPAFTPGLQVPGSGSGGMVSNPSQVPYVRLRYTEINDPGRYWIFQMGYAKALLMLANVRGKYLSIPYPTGAQTLNADALRAEADALQAGLLEELRAMLDATGRKAQLERQSEEARLSSEILAKIPLPIFVG